MYASKNVQSSELVGLLLERKDLDLDGKDNDGKTAEDFAADNENVEVVRMIREERSRRMGGVWAKTDPNEDDDWDVEEGSSEEEDDNGIMNKDLYKVEDLEISENAILKSQLIKNLQERLKKQIFLQKQCEQKYDLEVSKLKMSKDREEQNIKRQLQKLEEKFDGLKKSLDDEYNESRRNSESLINKIEHAIENIDLNKILNQSSSCTELECPICLEEMRPPMRIWQCVSGHAVCDICRRNPRVKECPTCRQQIVGRNVLAEKLAMSLFGHC